MKITITSQDIYAARSKKNVNWEGKQEFETMNVLNSLFQMNKHC